MTATIYPSHVHQYKLKNFVVKTGNPSSDGFLVFTSLTKSLNITLTEKNVLMKVTSLL